MELIILISIASLSIIINVILLWYSRVLVRQFTKSGVSLFDLSVAIHAFKEHVEMLMRSNIYKNDELIISLLEHVKEMSNKTADFSRDLSFIRPDIIQFVEDEKDKDEKKEE